MFFCEYCKIFKNPEHLFIEHIRWVLLFNCSSLMESLGPLFSITWDVSNNMQTFRYLHYVFEVFQSSMKKKQYSGPYQKFKMELFT